MFQASLKLNSEWACDFSSVSFSLFPRRKGKAVGWYSIVVLLGTGADGWKRTIPWKMPGAPSEILLYLICRKLALSFWALCGKTRWKWLWRQQCRLHCFPLQRTLRCQSVSCLLFVLYLQVLLRWRYTAFLQVGSRQEKVTALMEARKHLDIGELMERLNSRNT